MIKKRTMLIIFLLLAVMLFSSCAQEPQSVPTSSSEYANFQFPKKPTPATAAENLRTRVFIDASRSMIGFVDWEEGFESKYTGMTKLLLNELYDLAVTDNVSLFRFDLDLPVEYMKLGYTEFNAERKNPAFYNYREFDSVPSNIPRTNIGNEVITAKSIPGWFDGRKDSQPDTDTLKTAIDAGMPKEPYRVAIEQFGKQDELNIVVTDLYGLHSADAKNQFAKLKTDYLQPGKAVGVFVYESEFSGMLPSYAEGIGIRFWGLPPTGYYTGYKDRSYWWPQSATAKNRRFYQRFDIYGITMEERMLQIKEQEMKTRPVYILIAGMRDDVADVLDGLSQSANTYYRDLVYDCELFTTDRSDAFISESDIAVSTADNITQSGIMSFDIIKSVSNEDATITFTLPYIRNPLLDERPVAASDFTVTADIYPSGAGQEASSLSPVVLPENGKLIVSVDASDLAKGEYRLDLRIYLNAFPKNFAVLNKWNWQMNAQDIYYLSNLDDAEWAETARYDKTAGLSGLISMLEQEVNKSAEPIELCGLGIEINKLQ